MIQKIVLFLAGAATAFVVLNLNQTVEIHDDHEDHDHALIAMNEEKAHKHGIDIKLTGPVVIKTTFLTRGKVILDPDNRAEILPKVSGIVKDVKKNLGSRVRAADIVAVIESREVAEAKAHYLAAFQKEKLANLAFDRESILYNKKISSEEDFLQRQWAYEEAKIDLRLARQKLFAYGLIESDLEHLGDQNDETFSLYEVRSPIKGTVIKRQITHGEYLEGLKPIFEIADLSKVLVEIGVYPKDVHKVQKGHTASFECPPYEAEGTITFVSPLIDEDTITATALAELENKQNIWKPGTFVTVKIRHNEIPVPVAVAKEAIQYIDEQPVVFVQNKEGFVKTPVTLGRHDDHNVEISEGLEPGVPYAATNVFLLKADLGKDSIEHED